MNGKEERLNQSVELVSSLLENCYIEGTAVARVSPINSEKDLHCRSDVMGSTPVGFLFDNVRNEKKTRGIKVHGVTKNRQEEKAPLFLYCETTWNNDDEHVNMLEQVTNFTIITPVKQSSIFCNTQFSVTFEDPDNGKVLGRGEGYVHFDRA